MLVKEKHTFSKVLLAADFPGPLADFISPLVDGALAHMARIALPFCSFHSFFSSLPALSP